MWGAELNEFLTVSHNADGTLKTASFPPIVNADVDAAAAIAYSKLALANSIVDGDVATGAAIEASKLASYPSDGAKFLAGDGTWKAAGAAPTTYRKTTAKVVNTTVAATDLLNGEITVAAGAMGTTGMLRLTAWGDFLNNSGGLVAPSQIQLLLGGVTLIDTGKSGTVSFGVARYGWVLDATILNLGAANSQTTSFKFSLSVPSSTTSVSNVFTTGEGYYAGAQSVTAIVQAVGVNPATAVDTSAAKLLVLNVINGSASATYETKLLGAVVEII